MSIHQLPQVLKDKINNHIYECTEVGLIPPPCNTDQVVVTASNYLDDPPSQNVPQCCRNINQMQPYFNAKNMNMTNLKDRIVASLQPVEATPQKINELLVHNLQPGHFQLVDALLSFIPPNHQMLNLATASWSTAIQKPKIFHKLMSKQSFDLNVAVVLLNVLMNSPTDQFITYPASPSQLWKLCVPTLKEVSTYDCSHEWSTQFESQFPDDIQSEFEKFQFIKSFDPSLPNIPGIVVRCGDRNFEHCVHPCLSLILSRVQGHPDPVSRCESMIPFLSRYIDKVIRNNTIIDLSVVESFWYICVDGLNTISVGVRPSLNEILYKAFTIDDDILTTFLLQRFKSIGYTVEANDFIILLSDNSLNDAQKENSLSKIRQVSEIAMSLHDFIGFIKFCAIRNMFDTCANILNHVNFSLVHENSNTIARNVISGLLLDLPGIPRSQEFWDGTYIDHVLSFIRVLFNKKHINIQGEGSQNVRSISISLSSHSFIVHRVTLNILRSKVKNILGIKHITSGRL